MGRRLLVSGSHSIFHNLAFEAALYHQHLTERTLLLYINAPCVIIGRNQNVWRECRVAEIRRRGVALCRRFSGGGAVYQDLGNVCFSFMTPVAEDELPLERRHQNYETVVAALNALGVRAETAGRNDIVVDGRKVSGSAFRFELGSPKQQRRLLHHGTMLVDTDFGALEGLLSPSANKLRAKGIESVRARVANLAEIKAGIKSDDVIRELQAAFDRGSSPQQVTEEAMRATPGFAEELAKLLDERFVYNESSEFSITFEDRLSFGGVEAQIDAQERKVVRCRLFSDSLDPEQIDCFQQIINRRRPIYTREGLRALLDEPFIKSEEKPRFTELVDWLCSKVDQD